MLQSGQRIDRESMLSQDARLIAAQAKKGKHLNIEYLCGNHFAQLNPIIPGHKPEMNPGLTGETTPLGCPQVPKESNRMIEVREFVKTSQIDPIYIDRVYFLEPDSAASSSRLPIRRLPAPTGSSEGMQGRLCSGWDGSSRR